MDPRRPAAAPASPDVTLVNLITENVDGARWFPTGGLYVTSALEEAGYDVDFRDYQLFEHEDPYRPDVVADYFGSQRAPILGVGLMIDMLPLTLRAVALFKEKHPDVTVVLAGPGPSNLHDEILSRYPAVDVIVSGEGEMTATELVPALLDGKSLADVAGISYRDGDAIRTNPPRPRNAELVDLPKPAYHKVDLSNYDTFGVLFSRGCIFDCEFCEIPFIWQNGVQRRPIEDIITELIHLRDTYGIRRVEILDDLFVSNRRWTREFCTALLDAKVDIQWSCFGYISLMTEELLEMMAEAGCQGIFYGIEAGSADMIKKTGKKFTIEQARQTVLTTLKYMTPCSSFIWNYPYESLDDFYDTVSEFLYLANKGSNVRLHMLAPLKPTPFGRDYRDRMVFDEDVWCHLLRRRRFLHVTDMIRDDPDLFGAFYRFDTEGFATKLKVVESLIRRRD